MNFNYFDKNTTHNAIKFIGKEGFFGNSEKELEKKINSNLCSHFCGILMTHSDHVFLTSDKGEVFKLFLPKELLK